MSASANNPKRGGRRTSRPPVALAGAYLLPGGAPPSTPGAQAYLAALLKHSDCRQRMSEAVKAEAQAREALVECVRDYGPAHYLTDQHRKHLRAMRTVKHTASADLEAASEALDGALASWAMEPPQRAA